MKYFVCTLVAVMLSGKLLAQQTVNNPGAQALPDSVISKLKTGVAGFMERYHSPSMVVAIVHSGNIVFTEALGFANLEKRIPAGIDYPYPVLSVSKLFTATMLMQLKERGQLRLEDDVAKYLPEFKGGFNDKGRSGVSLLQLATHTSGLPRNSQADLVFAKQVDEWIITRKPMSALTPATKDALLQSLPAIRAQYEPYKFLSYGDRLYSNLGYCMLGIAGERAAKKDYRLFINQHIFQPLHMAASGFDQDEKKPVLAIGYFYDDSAKTFIPTPPFHSNGALYAGGMYSTARDLAKFISFQFDTTAEAGKVLSAANRAMMAAFRIGWKPDFPFVLHEGAMLGYRCIVVCNPDLKLGWVILTNTSEFEFSRINRYFAELLTPVFTPGAQPGIEKFAGEYQLEGTSEKFTITLKDGQLYSGYLAGIAPAVALTRYGPLRFRAAGRGAYTISYEFVSDPAGVVRSLTLGQLKWIRIGE
ncbi:MAG: class A beta-lactamase-related serine hydrolase [Chitinophagaceae bacterium]|nr:MAG: class A beta-lactamase-related serine hydrolase [Chitinophagaceae bacterium]